jgi:hypothetical protein
MQWVGHAERMDRKKNTCRDWNKDLEEIDMWDDPEQEGLSRYCVREQEERKYLARNRKRIVARENGWKTLSISKTVLGRKSLHCLLQGWTNPLICSPVTIEEKSRPTNGEYL